MPENDLIELWKAIKFMAKEYTSLFIILLPILIFIFVYAVVEIAFEWIIKRKRILLKYQNMRPER
jgi:hypothetical protein